MADGWRIAQGARTAVDDGVVLSNLVVLGQYWP
jgi:hypothetical protein